MKMQLLAALIPAGISFGPVFLSQFQSPWLLTAGLFCIFIYTQGLNSRIEWLEQRLTETLTTNDAEP